MERHVNLTNLQVDPNAFRDALFVDTDAGPRTLAGVMDPWQATDFAALDPGWRRVVGLPANDPKLRAWLERPRGHSKSTDIAVSVSWALFASRRKLSGVVAAGDSDQARLVRDAIDRLCRLNGWLASILDVQRDRVVNRRTGSELIVLTADAPTSYGLTPDFIVCDELTHWPNRDLWDSLLSAAAKRAGCLLLIITNAGFQESWQYVTREAVRIDADWCFSALGGSCASWISAKHLAEQRRLLPSIVFDRLWLNRWTAGAGDALTSEDVDAAFVAGLPPMDGNEQGFVYIGGLDLSVSKDHSAFVVVGKHRSGRYRLANVAVWRPSTGRKIDQMAIETSILGAHERFRLRGVAADPFQAEYLVSRLQRVGVPIHARPQSGTALREQAATFLEQFTSGNIDLHRHAQLETELRRLRVEERSYGLRLVSDRSDGSHGDCATALSIALAVARDVRGCDLTDWMRGAPSLVLPEPDAVAVQQMLAAVPQFDFPIRTREALR